jgi:imidazolonepropionase-like amidohydrolase
VVIRAGWALYKKGGYGSLFGVAVDSLEEIRGEILKLRKAGAGIIKVMASGMVGLSKPGSMTPGGFTKEELAFIVQESGRVGLRVMAHANGEEAIIASARAGVRSVEHGFFMSEGALEMMAEKGTFWTPTVGALARAAGKSMISAEAKAYCDGLIRSHQIMIQKADTFGVALAVGTDCVLPDPDYGSLYRAELQYFERAGLDRDRVLVIARDNGARLLGI